MNKKTSRYLIIALLFLPLLFAIVIGTKIDPLKLSGGTLKKVTVFQNETDSIDFEKEEDLKFYLQVTENATEIDHPLRSLENEQPIFITFTEADETEYKYAFYMTSNGDECYFKKSEENFFVLKKEDALNLITRKEFYYVYPNHSVPTITVSSSLGNTYENSNAYTWNWLRVDGEKIVESSENEVISEQNQILKIGTATDWQLIFSIEPDEKNISYRKDGAEISIMDTDFQNIMQNIAYESDTEIDISINAKWFGDEKSEYSGEASYLIKAFYDVPSSVKLDDKGLRQGGFTVVRLKNFNDDETLTIESNLKLNQSKVFNYNGEKFAFLTIGCDNPVGKEKITINGNAFDFEIKKREDYSDTPDTINVTDESKKICNTKESWAEYEKKISTLLEKSIEEKLWDGKYIAPLENGKTILSYATKRYISTVTEMYRHEAVDYSAEAGEKVRATNKGKVVFADEIALLGKLVVIDHGFGIFSYYGHLNTIDCTVGDDVLKEGQIGTVGSTGFAFTPQLHFAMSIGKNFIEPIHTSGLSYPN